MSKEKKFSAFELQIEEAELNKDGLNNLELLAQNWAEQCEFSAEELHNEALILSSVLNVASALKAKYPIIPMSTILIHMLNSLRARLKELE